MRTISSKLPESLYGDLAAVSAREGISRSELIRRALGEFLARKDLPERVNALTRLEGLVGCLEGPEDLSTNPAYLEDLGGIER
ncbi:MAG: ribbon-helix-helix protein, CopG family [Holophagales bacterium]|nr:ribbon-helix-helix protein, CopG family [Holophagales bacterium]